MTIAYRSKTSVANALRTNITVTAPAGAVSGSDIIEVYIDVGNSSSVTVSTPSGWTQAGYGQYSAADPWYVNMYRFVRVHDGASSWTFNHASGYSEASCTAWSGVDNTTPDDVTPATNNTGGSTTATINSITIATAGAQETAARGSWDGSAISPPTGWTEDLDQPVLWVGHKSATSSTGATGTTSVGAGSPDAKPWCTIHAALRPASGSSFAVSGTVAASSSVSGTAKLLGAPSGTVAAASTVSGAPAARVGVSGVVAASSDASGSPAALLPVSGVVAAVSGVSGSAALAGLAVSGTVVATSAASGAPTLLAASSGTVAAVSGITGAPDATHPVSGTVAGSSDASGTVTALRPVAGTVAAVSTVSGAPTIADAGAVSGVVAAVSGVSGSVAARLAVSGTAAASSTATGAPASRQGVAGTVAGVAVAVGAAAARRLVAGVVAALSAVTGRAGTVAAGDATPVYNPGVTLTVPTSVATLAVPSSTCEVNVNGYTVGDTGPNLVATLTSIPSSAFTGATCQVHVRKPGGTTVTLPGGQVTFDTAAGTVTVAWAAGDLDTAGNWLFEVQVTYSNGQIQTFPGAMFVVRDELA